MSPQADKFQSNRKKESDVERARKMRERHEARIREDAHREFARYISEECSNSSFYRSSENGPILDLEDIYITVNRFMESRGYIPLPDDQEE